MPNGKTALLLGAIVTGEKKRVPQDEMGKGKRGGSRSIHMRHGLWDETIY